MRRRQARPDSRRGRGQGPRAEGQARRCIADGGAQPEYAHEAVASELPADDEGREGREIADVEAEHGHAGKQGRGGIRKGGHQRERGAALRAEDNAEAFRTSSRSMNGPSAILPRIAPIPEQAIADARRGSEPAAAGRRTRGQETDLRACRGQTGPPPTKNAGSRNGCDGPRGPTKPRDRKTDRRRPGPAPAQPCQAAARGERGWRSRARAASSQAPRWSPRPRRARCAE